MTDEPPVPQPRMSEDGTTRAYSGPLPYGMIDDLVVPAALDLDGDERGWVPQSPGVDFRPILFSVTNGAFVNLLRVRRSGILSRHRHTGSVQAFVLRGRWHYLEYDWWAEEGSFAFEPPGDIHTLEVPSDVEEMITLFSVTGSYVYVDERGSTVGVEDVFSKIENARVHYESIGLGADHVDRFIR